MNAGYIAESASCECNGAVRRSVRFKPLQLRAISATVLPFRTCSTDHQHNPPSRGVARMVDGHHRDDATAPAPLMCLAKEWVVLVVPLACTCAGLYCAKGYDETTSRLEPAAVRVQRRPARAGGGDGGGLSPSSTYSPLTPASFSSSYTMRPRR